MSFSSGTFSLAAGNPVVTGTTISSTWANNTLSDIATGLTTCVLKDGTQTTTASVPFVFGIAVTTAITTPSTTLAVANTTATTVNAFGAATTLNIGNASGTNNFLGTFVTPKLGTPTSVVLTNATGLPMTTGVTGVLGAANGGTGVANNAASTITISGNYATTFTVTGVTGVTFPTSGTLAILGNNTFTGVQTLSTAASQNLSRVTVASHATTGDIWAAGHQIDWTGTATTTIFPNAPQAGAERVLICAGASSFTAGANMLIDGVSSGNTVTCAANDQMIVRAVSTTQFKLSRVKYDGTAQVQAVPVGSEMLWPTETPPTGWLQENGASLLRAGTYADLFAVIGTMYGTADGTHFNLPDSRGMFPRIWANGSANDPDRASRTVTGTAGATMTAGDHVGTEQADAFKAHTHTIDGVSSSTSTGNANTGFAPVGTVATASTGGNETRPINTYRMMIIKY